jgi:hypothetical protein
MWMRVIKKLEEVVITSRNKALSRSQKSKVDTVNLSKRSKPFRYPK